MNGVHEFAKPKEPLLHLISLPKYACDEIVIRDASVAGSYIVPRTTRALSKARGRPPLPGADLNAQIKAII